MLLEQLNLVLKLFVFAGHLSQQALQTVDTCSQTGCVLSARRRRLFAIGRFALAARRVIGLRHQHDGVWAEITRRIGGERSLARKQKEGNKDRPQEHGNGAEEMTRRAARWA